MIVSNPEINIAEIKKRMKKIRLNRDYSGGYGRKTFLVEPLPPGTLPIYDKLNWDWRDTFKAKILKAAEDTDVN